ncbi:ImmA/IrrE family metallo-endopeptidase [Desulfococcaceae bacterium HSG7]|nr:ImmA/IrrE family metallo-endopeptidase [Desulfococcaceae bacterium HSG7]
MQTVSPHKKAGLIIKDLTIQNPSEIIVRDIAMTRGAYVREKILEGIEARLVRKGKLGIITVNQKIPEVGRKRFAIAHELGHFELHSSSQLKICSEKDMFVWNENKSQELEANDFAGNLLMPEFIFADHVNEAFPQMNTIKSLADEFRTTLTATTLRYIQISSEPCAVAFSKDGIIQWYKKSKSFNYHVKAGEKLSPDSYAFDFFQGDNLPNGLNEVPVNAWIAGNFSEDDEIMEHSVELHQYNTVISLLWINQEIKSYYSKIEDEPEFDLTNPFTPDGKRWQW